MAFVKNILVLLFLVALHVQTGNGISCYECGTSNSPLCTTSDVGSLELQQCPANLNRCYYVHYDLNGDNTIMRFCTDRTVINCPDLPFPSGIDGTNARCKSINSCRGPDGCNNHTASFTPVNSEPVDPATILSCFQCGINGAPVCAAQGVGNLKPQKCTASDKYRVTVKATTSSGVAVQRYCSRTEVTNCVGVPRNIDCDAKSCQKDDCNAAGLVKARLLAVLSAALLCMSYLFI